MERPEVNQKEWETRWKEKVKDTKREKTARRIILEGNRGIRRQKG